MAGEMTLRVAYYAVLRERAGTGEETVRSRAATPLELYAEVSRLHDLGIEPSSLRVAVNERIVGWDAPLADGDTVVFLPPFAGG
ncbi:MAG TPA: MoaD/ThiS family protein [Spirochaetia bacterium]